MQKLTVPTFAQLFRRKPFWLPLSRRTVWLICWSIIVIVEFERPVQGQVVSRFSIAAGELYNDNIFFEQNKQSDFVTLLIPTLSLVYKPSGYPEPTFNLSLSAPAEIFARHTELDNIGDNMGLNANYLYRYSPRLNFTFTDRLLRRGESRLGGLGYRGDEGGVGRVGGGGRGQGGIGIGSMGGLSTGGFGGFGGGGYCRQAGGIAGVGGGTVQRSEDLVVSGALLDNQLGGRARFQYSQDVAFEGGYCWGSLWFFDEGGKETSHSFGIAGEYNLWRLHTFRIGYTISFFRSRNGQDDILHDFDLGDDFLGGIIEEVLPTRREIYLTPTLRIRASAGIGVRTPTSRGGNFNVGFTPKLELIKLWKTADLTIGVQRNLTGSLGVSGSSFTTTFFSRFSIQLSQRLAGFAGAESSLFDAEDANFKTLIAVLGLQYWLTSWLSANLAYSYQWTDSGSGSLARDALGSENIDSNSVFLFFAVHFDVWPRFGLAKRGMGSPLGPALRSPARTSPSRQSP